MPYPGGTFIARVVLYRSGPHPPGASPVRGASASCPGWQGALSPLRENGGASRETRLSARNRAGRTHRKIMLWVFPAARVAGVGSRKSAHDDKRLTVCPLGRPSLDRHSCDSVMLLQSPQELRTRISLARLRFHGCPGLGDDEGSESLLGHDNTNTD